MFFPHSFHPLGVLHSIVVNKRQKMHFVAMSCTLTLIHHILSCNNNSNQNGHQHNRPNPSQEQDLPLYFFYRGT